MPREKKQPRLVGEKVRDHEENVELGAAIAGADIKTLSIVIEDWTRADQFLKELGYDLTDEKGLFLPMSERIKEALKDVGKSS